MANPNHRRRIHRKRAPRRKGADVTSADSPTAEPERRRRLDRELAARLYAEGLNITQIAERTGFAWKTVHSALRKQGIGPRPAATAVGPWARELYELWKRLRRKCRSPRHESYGAFGGQGIDICAEWEQFPAFRDWARATGFRPELALGRIDDAADFSPQNCCWLTRAEIVRRTRRAGSPLIEAFGETKTLAEWHADPRCRVAPSLLRRRLQAGHEPELAMTARSLRGAPVRKRARPLLRAKPRPRKRVPAAEWRWAEREWCERRTTVTDIVRRLGIGRAAVERRLGHLPRPAPEPRRLPRKHESRLRHVWRMIHLRANDPAEPGYRYVGAKGVSVCRAWQRFEPFLEWAVREGYAPGLWLMLRDRRKNYSPSNCVWMTPEDARRKSKPGGQKRPQPRRPVDAFGESRSVTGWADDPRCMVSRMTLSRRIAAGWEPEAAITTPAQLPGPPAKIHISAFGERKSVVEWARDPRCSVSAHGIRQRLQRGVPAEEAVSAPPFEVEPEGDVGRSQR